MQATYRDTSQVPARHPPVLSARHGRPGPRRSLQPWPPRPPPRSAHRRGRDEADLRAQGAALRQYGQRPIGSSTGIGRGNCRQQTPEQPVLHASVERRRVLGRRPERRLRTRLKHVSWPATPIVRRQAGRMNMRSCSGLRTVHSVQDVRVGPGVGHRLAHACIVKTVPSPVIRVRTEHRDQDRERVTPVIACPSKGA
jgi:hypothetical protein